MVSEYTIDTLVNAERAAEILNITPDAMQTLLRAGRIVGAEKVRFDWCDGYDGWYRWWIPTPIKVLPSNRAAGMPREDETVEYQIRGGGFVDAGCEVAAKCLKCPLDWCKLELGAGVAWDTLKRHQAIAKTYHQIVGKMSGRYQAQKHTADEYGISERTVSRVLALERGGKLNHPGLAPVIRSAASRFKTPRPLPPIRPAVAS